MANMAISCVPRTAAAVALVVALAGAAAGCAHDGAKEQTPRPLKAEILAVHPFDTGSFTQGLEVDSDGSLLVGTGMTGESRVYRRPIDTDRHDQEAPLDPQLFGEGITRAGSSIWQLTWRDGVAIRRDAKTLEETGRLPWPGQGWGICALDEDTLAASDGTSTIRLLDAADLSEKARVEVGGERPVAGLNELECVAGTVYANIFMSTRILRFDPENGEILEDIDASGLPNNAAADADNVLNGIAHLPGTDRFLLSGKRWPDLYEVRFVPRDQATQ